MTAASLGYGLAVQLEGGVRHGKQSDWPVEYRNQ